MVFRNGKFSLQSSCRSGWCSHNGHVLGKLAWPTPISTRASEGGGATFSADGFFTARETARVVGKAAADGTFQPRGNWAKDSRSGNVTL